MRPSAFKGALDRLREAVGVVVLLRMDQQQVHQVAPARRATASMVEGGGQADPAAVAAGVLAEAAGNWGVRTQSKLKLACQP